MSNCKTCEKPISWDAKKREELHVRVPVNLDGTIHQCITNESTPLDTKELGLTAAIHKLTTTINNLIYCYLATTENERQAIKSKMKTLVTLRDILGRWCLKMKVVV